MKIKLFQIIFSLLIFLIYSCSERIDSSKFDLYKKKNDANYKICLADANYNVEQIHNINQDRMEILQTDDTMIDFYNIDNDIDIIKLSTKRDEMVNECMKRRAKK